MTTQREVAVLLGVVLLAGCPQLLNDDFQAGLSDPGSALDPGLALDSTGTGGMAGGTGSAGAAGADVGSAGGSGADAEGADAGGADNAPPDASPPSPVVVSAVPADGARGVLADAELVFTFSAPMDTVSVAGAYVSSELPSAQVSFTWSEGDTVLSIRPNSPLHIATGSDPATLLPASYSVNFTAQAKDKEGNALVPEHVGFSVVRSITGQQLGAVEDHTWTGSWRSDGMTGLGYCLTTNPAICTGDGSATYKAFVTFDLAGVPTNLLSFSAAELSSTVGYVNGAPFSLGALELEHVEFSAIGTDAYSALPLSAARSMSTGAAVGDVLSADVLADVQADWGARAHSQFRLSFPTASNGDSVADQLGCDWSTVHLTLSYLAP